ncbi:MAG: ABC transporter permease [Planctomycetes bacterium]|nr:ABC transporter permease [Planctomycetota bacterium]
MSPHTLLRIVLVGIARAKLRSALTALTVAIGVCLVVTVGAIGAGARIAVEKAAESMGTNVFNVWPSATMYGGVRTAAGSQATLTLDDIRAIREEVDVVLQASGQVRLGGSQCVHRNKNWSTAVLGVETGYFEARAWPVAEGRLFTDVDVAQAQRVCVIGQRVASELFALEESPAENVQSGGVQRALAATARENPIGVTIKIRGMPFRVLGVLAPKGQNAMGWDQDDNVIIPLTTTLKRMGATTGHHGPIAVNSAIVAATSAATVEQAMQAVRELLARRHNSPAGAEEFSVRNFGDAAEAAAKQQRILAMLLATIAAISLLVGGIGIMNIMLVSVTERTREIGIRLAVGAKPRHILAQFLLEALAISGVGGLLGIGSSFVAAWAVASWLEWAAPISSQSVAVAASVSIAIGAFFGFYPARRAARLDPIEALRYE